MAELVSKSGEEAYDPAVIAILGAPIDDTLVDIRPDGLIYVSHVHYRDRLDRAFGVGGWILVPLGKPEINGKRVTYHGFLKAGGRYVSDAIGGSDYIPHNPIDTYDNAVEKAKSDCIVRCCKALPMFRECWDKDYADYWRATYAEEVAMPNTRAGRGWKKHGSIARNFDSRPGRLSEGEYKRPPSLTDENQAHLDSIDGNKRLLLASKDEYNDNAEYYDDGRED